ncbi:Wzz/FepE/Etk N-terminal domain-containing protein [Prevotella sp.]|uniref:Wzz/FepE/Etk N-terminal domain-containing protein n=1 Tax=Prevotella sp. TaxID=59823 RepID=UPI0026489690|nr:Wzz/FepE/Etk N-terminal domain-containing protein [Prevotella sp.]MDN5554341.1 chain-length determining protein [Prevotella sp.]
MDFESKDTQLNNINETHVKSSQNGKDGSSIDFKAIFAALCKHKLLYIIIVPLSLIIGFFYAKSLPKYYQCQVALAPELGGGATGGGALSSLASSMGYKVGGNKPDADAITPTLYPDLMNSVDFKTSLFDVKVHRMDSSKVMAYYDYLLYYQKTPWWSRLFSANDTIRHEKLNPFMLTKKQTAIAKIIDKNVICDVDIKTDVITINVTDQDPLIAATMADSVKARLQTFITKYRTNKARNDLESTKKLCVEAKRRYEHARQLYGAFSDANQEVILESVRSKQEDLENDMQLQFNNYNALAANLQAAYAKVQAVTPVFTTLQSATVPTKKAGPKNSQIVMVFLFVGLLIPTIYALVKEGELNKLL